MRSKITLCIFTLLLITSDQLFAQWQNHGTGLSAPDVCVVDMSVPSDNVVWGILSVFAQGTCGGQVPYITRSVNGVSFGPRSIPMPVDVTPVCISALNANTAWVAAANIASNTTGLILKTTNGGATWVTQPTANFVDAARFIHFYDANEGVAVGDSSVFLTSDGGANWYFSGALPVPSDTIGTGVTTFLLNCYDVLGDNIWMGDGWGYIYKSSDRGHTWELTYQPPSYIGIKGISFRDALYGIAVASYYVGGGSGGPGGNADNTLYTTDGGYTWSPVIFNIPTANCSFQEAKYDVEFVPGTSNTFIVTSEYDPGYAAFSLISDDGGMNWSVIDSTIQHTVCVFTSPASGYSGGYIPDFTSGVFRWSGPLPSAINEADLMEGVELFPNPAKDLLTVNMSVLQMDDDYEYQIMDISGQLLEENHVNQMEMHIDLSRYAKGVYIFRLFAGNGVQVNKRFIKG